MKGKFHCIQIELILNEEEMRKLERLAKAKEIRYGRRKVTLEETARDVTWLHFTKTLEDSLRLYEGLGPIEGIWKEAEDAEI